MPKPLDSELVAKLTDFFLISDEDTYDWRIMAKDCFDFAMNRQWTDPDTREDVKASLRAVLKPALTYNLVTPRLEALSGILEKTKTEPVFVARRGGNIHDAKVISEIIKHARDMSNADFLEAIIFEDGNTCGSGWYSADIELSDDSLGGQIVLRRYSPVDVFEDPRCADYDLNKGADFVILSYWVSNEEAQQRYPKHAKDIGEMFANIKTGTYATVNEELYKHARSTLTMEAHRRWSHRELFCYWRSWEVEDRLVDNADGSWAVIGKGVKADMISGIIAADPGRYEVLEGIVTSHLHRTIMLGGIILRHDEDVMGGIKKYPVYRYCPRWKDGEISGLVEPAMDAQREYNKRLTQALLHLNQSANSGWLIPMGMPIEARTNYEMFGSRPGVVLEWDTSKPKPERIQPSNLSIAHITLAREAAFRISEVMGVNTETLGYEQPRKESGIAIQERKEAGQTVNEPIYRNFRMTQKLAAESMFEIIRTMSQKGMPIYTDEEILAIVESNKAINLEALSDWKVGQYGVLVTHRATTPTERMVNLQTLMAMSERLPGVIPPKMIIEASDIENKEEIVQQMEQAQAGGQMPQAPGISPTSPG